MEEIRKGRSLRQTDKPEPPPWPDGSLLGALMRRQIPQRDHARSALAHVFCLAQGVRQVTANSGHRTAWLYCRKPADPLSPQTISGMTNSGCCPGEVGPQQFGLRHLGRGRSCRIRRPWPDFREGCIFKPPGQCTHDPVSGIPGAVSVPQSRSFSTYRLLQLHLLKGNIPQGISKLQRPRVPWHGRCFVFVMTDHALIKPAVAASAGSAESPWRSQESW